MIIKPLTSEAYQLFHAGTLALSHVEANGIRIDVPYLKSAIHDTGTKIDELTEKLKQDAIYNAWKKTYGSKTNLGSRTQLGKVLFGVMKYPCKSLTATGRARCDVHVLETIKLDFVKNFLAVEKLKKARSTYLRGILNETCDGFLHPVFHLHLVSSFRSSSSEPNFQNLPIRDPEMGRLIRRAFVSRGSDWQLVEADLSGAEINCAAWYHKDPVMLEYIHDKSKDLHRDMAMQCYKLPLSELTPVNNTDEEKKRVKSIRYCGKNCFVFPQFYGDYYIDCAASMWRNINKMKLHLADGTSLREHLANKGIKTLGRCDKDQRPMPNSFEKYIQEVEQDFWGRRFKVYDQWRKDWYKDYLKTGRFEFLTGFEVEASLKRNQVINLPVQGVAFHCLLWSLIQINKKLRKYNMKSLIIGQIHDSIVSDVFCKELKQYCEIVKHVIEVDLRKYWKWIITPLEAEIEACPPGGSWFDKGKFKI